MSQLSESSCVPCRGNEPALTQAEIAQLRPELPDWSLVEEEGVKRLERVFRFRNYRDALSFTNKVAEAANEQDHHPLIILEWGKVTVQWWTHKIRGLHRNDFIMAAKTDQLFK
jgi:4a-hydroxytetrahydrobiopterin dehydratase